MVVVELLALPVKDRASLHGDRSPTLARGVDLEAALVEIEASVREAAELRVRRVAFDELMVGDVNGSGSPGDRRNMASSGGALADERGIHGPCSGAGGTEVGNRKR